MRKIDDETIATLHNALEVAEQNATLAQNEAARVARKARELTHGATELAGAIRRLENGS
jgi:hypothetical protein